MDNLIAALNRVTDAQRAHDDAFAEYGGYSWGYVGRHLIMAVEDARKDFERVLGEFVDKRVNDALIAAGVLQ